MPSGVAVGAFLLRALGVLLFLLVALQGGIGAVEMRENGTSVVWALSFLALIAGVAIVLAYAFFVFARSIERQ